MKSALRNFSSRARAPFSAVLILLLLVIQTLAASPDLHLDLHDEADSDDHSCAVTTLTQGQIDVTDSASSLTLPAATPFQFFSVSSLHIDSQFFSVDSSRGPPSLA
jgi:hypothetical protein